MKNGDIPQDLAPGRGGHSRIRDVFKMANPDIDASQIVGFTIYYREQGKLDVAFFSRGINVRNFKDLDGYAPEAYQQKALEALRQSTGLEVESSLRLTLPD